MDMAAFTVISLERMGALKAELFSDSDCTHIIKKTKLNEKIEKRFMLIICNDIWKYSNDFIHLPKNN